MNFGHIREPLTCARELGITVLNTRELSNIALRASCHLYRSSSDRAEGGWTAALCILTALPSTIPQPWS